MARWTDAEARLFARLSECSPYYKSAESGGVLPYLAALALSLCACLFVELEICLFGVATHFPIYVALILSIRYCGRRAAWFSAAVSTLGVMWFIPPMNSLAVDLAEIPRLLNNVAAMGAVILLWPRHSFGDLAYRLSAIQRRAMASIRRQKSSSSSSIGRLSIASRSRISP